MKIKKFGRDRFINSIFLVYILSTIMAYSVHAIVTISSGKYVLWTYAEQSINVGSIGRIIIYVKDILVILLFLLLGFKKNKCSKIVIGFTLISFYGTVILILSGAFSIGYLVAGIRSYLTFVVAILYLQYRKIYDLTEDKKQRNWQEDGVRAIDKSNYRYLVIALLLETFFVFAQVLISGVTRIGSGGYRFTGSFGNSGGLGCYCIGMTMMVVAYGVKSKKEINTFQKLRQYGCLFLLFMMSWASGMRSSMMIVLLLVSAYTLLDLYEIFNLKKKEIIIGFLFILITGGSTVYSKIVDIIGRGDLLESGSTRISIFFELLFPNNIFYMMFGRGIGQATNAAKNLGADGAVIADGTFNTVIAQFGMIGLVVFLVASIYVSEMIIKRAREHRFIASLFVVALSILFITGNYFEQFSLVVLSVYSIYILLNDNRRKRDRIYNQNLM